MITKRQSLLVKMLLDQNNRFMNSKEIAEVLGISIKTAQTETHNILDYLSQNHIKLISKRGFGYKLSLENNANEYKNLLIKGLNDEAFHEGDDMLCDFLYCYIFLANEYVSQEDLAYKIYSNKNKIKRLMDQLNINIDYCNVRITAISGKGYRIEGNESSKRILFTTALEVLKVSEKYVQILHDEFPKYFGYHRDFSIQDITDIMVMFDVYLSELDIIKLLDYIILLKYRFNQNNVVETFCPESFIIIINPSIEHIAHKIMNTLNIEMNWDEQQYLGLFILFSIDPSQLESHIEYNYVIKDYEEVINHFFSKRNELYHDIFIDLEHLKHHILCNLAIIIDSNQFGYNRIIASDEHYSDEFYVAIEIASILGFEIENIIKVKFTRYNILSLAILINLNFKDSIWNTTKKVFVLSNESLSYADFLCRKIKMNYPEISIPIVLKSKEEFMKELKKENDALFISDRFFDLEKDNVLSFPSLSAYTNVIQALSPYLSQMTQSLTFFFSCMKKDNFHYDVSFTKMEEVIDFLVHKYQIDEKRERQILINLYRREKRYISIVQKDVAIPRIYLTMIQKPILEIFILRNEIAMNENQVSLFFVILLPSSYKYQTVVGKFQSLIVQNPYIVDNLRKISCFEEFKDRLQYYFAIMYHSIK